MDHIVMHASRYAYGGHDIREHKVGAVLREDDEAFETARAERWIYAAADLEWPPVPRLYEGETVACVASGPSLTQKDVELLRGRMRVIVVNDNHRLAPWADLLYAADEAWWNAYEGVPEFKGLKVTVNVPASKRWNLRRIPIESRPGLSHDPNRLHGGGNSGYQAVNLAWLLGAKRILLLGYDMQATAGCRHWFGDHPKPLRNGGAGAFERWARNFATIPPTLNGVEVLNCTRMTALSCFPRVPLEEALQ